MKRFVSMALIIAVCLACAGVVGASASGHDPLPTATVLIDGAATDLPGVVIDGRTYIPLRIVLEAVGAQVDWDEASRTVSVRTAKVEPVTDVGASVDVSILGEQTAEEIYAAACQAALDEYEEDVKEAGRKYLGSGIGENCEHWAAYKLACEEAYEYYTDINEATFSDENYALYLAHLAALRAERAVACAAAGCADLEQLYEAAVAAAADKRDQALADALAVYEAATAGS